MGIWIKVKCNHLKNIIRISWNVDILFTYIFRCVLNITATQLYNSFQNRNASNCKLNQYTIFYWFMKYITTDVWWTNELSVEILYINYYENPFIIYDNWHYKYKIYKIFTTIRLFCDYYFHYIYSTKIYLYIHFCIK